MLHLTQDTIDAVRAGRVLSRQIRLNREALAPALAAQVDEFLTAIGGHWSAAGSAYHFKCHPHAAIGRALFNDTIAFPSPSHE